MTLQPLYNPPGLPLAGRRVVCFGIGASGVASGLFLNSHGVDALVVDEQPAGKLQGRLAELERAGVRALPGLTSSTSSTTATPLSASNPATLRTERRSQAGEDAVASGIRVPGASCTACLLTSSADGTRCGRAVR